MALYRSGSHASTLSKIQHGVTRYSNYIILASVFLIIASTIVIFTSTVLIKWYFMPNLSFWDQKFLIAPYLMLAVGIYKLIISLYGFGITATENRRLLILFAVLLAIAFVGQIASIFMFWQIKTLVELKNVGSTQAAEELINYGKDGYEITTNAWDHMQSHLHCCGAHGANIGYQDWKNTPLGQDDDSVPDSCCRAQAEQCGKGMLRQPDDVARKSVYVDGCLLILIQWMETDVAPMIGVYSGVGIAIALVELIAVVLVCAYVAQINRRQQREENVWNATRGDDRDAGREIDGIS